MREVLEAVDASFDISKDAVRAFGRNFIVPSQDRTKVDNGSGAESNSHPQAVSVIESVAENRPDIVI